MLNPLNQIDAYKLDHRRQYPEGTQFVYSNFTPRSSRVAGQKHVVNFGLQAFIKEWSFAEVRAILSSHAKLAK